MRVSGRDNPGARAPARSTPALPGFFVLLALVVASTPLAAERLIVRNYTVIDGLASDRVVCLVNDRDGFLWICTSGGLSRFDGSRFVTYGTAAGLPDAAVNHILQTRSGSRWVATNGGGVARLEAGEPGPDGRFFTAFDVGSSPRSMRVNILFEARDGALLAGTDGGLFRARYPDASPVFDLVPLAIPGYPESALQVWGVTEDGAGRIWIGTSGGLVLVHGDRRVVHIPVEPAQGADHVYGLVVDEAGRLWLGHDTGVFVWLPPGSPGDGAAGRARLGERAGPCAGTLPARSGEVCRWAPGGGQQGRSVVRSLLQADDGWIWMAAQAGLGVYDGVRFRLFHSDHGLPASTFTRLAMDPGGDLWVGSTAGAHRVQRRGFRIFTAEDGLAEPRLRTLHRGRDGNLYVVSTTSVIHRFDGDSWTAVRPNLPASAGGVGRSIYGTALLDRDGAWWMGTGDGVVRFPAVARLEDLATTRPMATYTAEDGLAGDDIWQLFEDSRGDIWIATRIPGAKPLTRWERHTGGFRRFGPGDGLPAERAVRDFLEEPAGTLWISLWDGGLARFDGERFQYFAPGDDVPPGHLYGLLVDRRGWLWVAGRQTFYSREPGAATPRFASFHALDGEPLTSFALAEVGDGWIYAQTVSGLVRFRPEDGRVQQLGFGSPFVGAGDRRFHRDPGGSLWFVSDGSVLHYEPRPFRSGGPPPVRIGEVRVAGVPLPVPPLGARSVEGLRFAPRHRQVQFDYFGFGFGADEPLRFQFRLDGVDEGWGSPTAQASVMYAGLGPGRYRFRVRAVSATGEVSAEPATVAFTIPPPVWRRGWFLAAVAVALAGALASAHRLRVRRLLELERVRTRIAADLHDDLGSSLARVSLLSDATRRSLRDAPDRAERMLVEIGATSRELVAAAGDIAFSIDPGRGGLDGLVARVRRFAEDLLAGTGVDWSFTLAGEAAGVVLSSEQRRHLLAIIKESIHNAVRHGRPRHLDLTLTVEGDALEVTLEDDGRGFLAEPTASGPAAPGPEAGQGLRNMRQRAAELGTRLEVAARPGGGTRVSVRCPLHRPPRMVVR